MLIIPASCAIFVSYISSLSQYISLCFRISDNLVISDVNERWNNNRNPYQITTKYIYNENKEPIILECLGNAYDTRSESTKLLNIDSRYDKNLHDNLKKYSFKGYLYELIIFKSDD